MYKRDWTYCTEHTQKIHDGVVEFKIVNTFAGTRKSNINCEGEYK